MAGTYSDYLVDVRVYSSDCQQHKTSFSILIRYASAYIFFVSLIETKGVEVRRLYIYADDCQDDLNMRPGHGFDDG